MSAHGFAEFFVLRGRNIVQCPDVEQWEDWMATANLTIRLFQAGDYTVSTVFLGVAKGTRDGAPLLFETVVSFQGQSINQAVHSATLEEAERVQNLIAQRLKATVHSDSPPHPGPPLRGC